MFTSLVLAPVSQAEEEPVSEKVQVKCKNPHISVHARLRAYVTKVAGERDWPSIKSRICYERTLTRFYTKTKSPRQIEKLIEIFFQGRASGAKRVGKCESTYQHSSSNTGVNAKNGRYAGIFQISRRGRKQYGWYRVGSPAYYQIKSAHRMSQGGRNWGPWECRP